MADFKSPLEYFEFCRAVTEDTRYMLSADSRQFIKSVLKTIGDRELLVRKGSVLWRAQLGRGTERKDNVDYIVPYKPERMKPLQDGASEGRVNPKGIPVLYLSTERDTALSEVRPWEGEFVSIARFMMVEDVRLVNCSNHEQVKLPEHQIDSFPEEFWTEYTWQLIEDSFTQPVTRSDRKAEYAPTQILSEAFKTKGFDGVAYKSSLSKSGQNIALFRLDSAECLDVGFAVTKSVIYEFTETYDLVA